MKINSLLVAAIDFPTKNSIKIENFNEKEKKLFILEQIFIFQKEIREGTLTFKVVPIYILIFKSYS